ncbi:hypothetical protein N9047_00735 [bacterium]|nr:hypothetical protein [bacterium]MDB4386371.1 hypothetical protein [bacterium]MDB4460697.1 hypothetical protein [bacterium]MDC0294007.1 hypothetical protein [Mariniblastus sp.]
MQLEIPKKQPLFLAACAFAVASMADIKIWINPSVDNQRDMRYPQSARISGKTDAIKKLAISPTHRSSSHTL